MSVETLPPKSRSTPDTCNKERAEKEERYIVVSNDLPPPETEQACQSYIEQVIQEGIKKGDYVDNIVFQILNLKDVNEATLQAMIQNSDNEETKRILQRAVQIWERRKFLTRFLESRKVLLKNCNDKAWLSMDNIDTLATIFDKQMAEDDFEVILPESADMFATVFLLLDKYRDTEKHKQVLDIGPAKGALLHLLRAYDFEGMGLEFNPSFARYGQNRGQSIIVGDIFSPPQKLKGQKFPITVSTAVLDIMKGDYIKVTEDDVREFLQQVAELTEIGGISIHVYENLDILADRVFECDGLFEILSRCDEIHLRFDDAIVLRHVVLKRIEKANQIAKRKMAL